MGVESFGGNYDNLPIYEGNNEQVVSSFNDSRREIGNKALKYYKINKNDFDRVQSLHDFIQGQEQDRNHLREQLEAPVLSETRDELDKQAMINEAKTMLYEKLGISENMSGNNWGENFSKGLVDTLILDNYDLAIQVWETNGKVILDGISQLFSSWENIKKMAEALGESVMGLFSLDGYQTGKSIAELGLIGSGIGAGVFVGKKAFKLGMKQISKLRKSSEKVVESSSVKQVIGETTSRVDEIVPKKELDVGEIAKKSVDIERQVKGLESLGVPESFSRDMLESGLMNQKFLGGDLLRRFEALKANKIDINDRIDSVMKKIPELTREEALLIFSYTDEIIFRDLNSYMRGILKKDLTEANINAINNIITKLESGLNKMPDLKPGKDGFILRGDNWIGWKKGLGEEIDLEAFTSVANNKKDAFIGDEFNTNIEISIIGKQGRIKDVSDLSIAVNYGVTKGELETLTDFSGKLKKLPKTNNEGIILPNSKVVVLERYQGAETYYTKVKQTQ
ncbi:MAG: hypothetical protein PHV23_05230 [Candidatus Gracilibacteria bacterium]|nr:hypothetical protein [Candidatus Gracilibacteria bacterium]